MRSSEGEGKREREKGLGKGKGKGKGKRLALAGPGRERKRAEKGGRKPAAASETVDDELRKYADTAADYMKSGGPNWQLFIQSQMDQTFVFVAKIKMLISPKI